MISLTLPAGTQLSINCAIDVQAALTLRDRRVSLANAVRLNSVSGVGSLTLEAGTNVVTQFVPPTFALTGAGFSSNQVELLDFSASCTAPTGASWSSVTVLATSARFPQLNAGCEAVLPVLVVPLSGFVAVGAQSPGSVVTPFATVDGELRVEDGELSDPASTDPSLREFLFTGVLTLNAGCAFVADQPRTAVRAGYWGSPTFNLTQSSLNMTICAWRVAQTSLQAVPSFHVKVDTKIAISGTSYGVLFGLVRTLLSLSLTVPFRSVHLAHGVALGPSDHWSRARHCWNGPRVRRHGWFHCHRFVWLRVVGFSFCGLCWLPNAHAHRAAPA